MKLITLLLLSLFVTPSHSQAFDYWVGIFPHYQINETQKLSMQSEFRNLEGLSIGLFRPAYHIKLSSLASLGLGYDLFIQQKNEQRLWPELTGRIPFNNKTLFFDWRARHEFRFLEDATRTGQRSRFMLGLQVPLSEKEMKTSLYLFNEAFLSQKNFTGRYKQEWDRNWLGFRTRLQDNNITYDLGLFWEHIFNQNEDNFVTTFSMGFLF